MCEFQEKDDRYRYCLEQLGKKLDKHFEIIEIQKNELEEVQVFDTFMKEYREILNDIRAVSYTHLVIGGSYYEKIHYGTGRRDNK